MACKHCDGTGTVFRVNDNIPKGHRGWSTELPCVCTIKKEILNDIFSYGGGMARTGKSSLPQYVEAIPKYTEIKYYKENKMLKDVRIGSTVEFIDDTGKYPLIVNGTVQTIVGDTYLVGSHCLTKSDICTSGEQLNEQLREAALQRVHMLNSLIGRLYR